MTGPELAAVAPFGYVVALALLVIVADIARPGDERATIVIGTIGTLVGIALVVAVGLGGTVQPVFGGAYQLDPLTTFLDLLFLSIAFLTILFSPDYLRPRHYPLAEYVATLLFAISGAMLISAARDLLVLFLGLELLVLPGYMLVAYAKRDGLATEGAIKYFLLGSFSLGHLPVRPGLHLGLHRHHERGGRGLAPPAGGDQRAGAGGRAADGPRAHDHRGGLQDRRGALPLLDARRLPGLAHPGHRLPLGRAQDRRLRPHPAPLRGGPRARCAPTGSASSWCWPP